MQRLQQTRNGNAVIRSVRIHIRIHRIYIRIDRIYIRSDRIYIRSDRSVRNFIRNLSTWSTFHYVQIMSKIRNFPRTGTYLPYIDRICLCDRGIRQTLTIKICVLQ